MINDKIPAVWMILWIRFGEKNFKIIRYFFPRDSDFKHSSYTFNNDVMICYVLDKLVWFI